MAGRIVIYTDGSALGNPGPGGWAFVSEDGRYVGKGKAHLTTSNRMEFAALIAALRTVPEGSRLEVRTDSRLLIQLFNGTWKARTPEIVELLNTAKLIARQRKIELDLVKVRSKRSDGNLVADHLAKEGMKSAARDLPIETCERCGNPMVPRLGRYGAFLACINPECGATRPLPKDKKAAVEALLTGGGGGKKDLKAKPRKRRRRP